MDFEGKCQTVLGSQCYGLQRPAAEPANASDSSDSDEPGPAVAAATDRANNLLFAYLADGREGAAEIPGKTPGMG